MHSIATPSAVSRRTRVSQRSLFGELKALSFRGSTEATACKAASANFEVAEHDLLTQQDPPISSALAPSEAVSGRIDGSPNAWMKKFVNPSSAAVSSIRERMASISISLRRRGSLTNGSTFQSGRIIDTKSELSSDWDFWLEARCSEDESKSLPVRTSNGQTSGMERCVSFAESSLEDSPLSFSQWHSMGSRETILQACTYPGLSELSGPVVTPDSSIFYEARMEITENYQQLTILGIDTSSTLRCRYGIRFPSIALDPISSPRRRAISLLTIVQALAISQLEWRRTRSACFAKALPLSPDWISTEIVRNIHLAQSDDTDTYRMFGALNYFLGCCNGNSIQ